MTDAPSQPARRTRHDGWTEERKAAFVAALERGGTIAAAAASVGMSRNSAYRLRASPDGAAATAAWGKAAAPVDFGEFIDIIESRSERKFAAADAADTRGTGAWIMRDLRVHIRRAKRREWAAARRRKAAEKLVVS